MRYRRQWTACCGATWASKTLEEPRFFFGRRALIDDILNALNRREHAAIIGPRKTGKSSLLNLLCQKLNAYLVAMVDLQLYNRDNPKWP